jgi:hypothetical protein
MGSIGPETMTPVHGIEVTGKKQPPHVPTTINTHVNR